MELRICIALCENLSRAPFHVDIINYKYLVLSDTCKISAALTVTTFNCSRQGRFDNEQALIKYIELNDN